MTSPDDDEPTADELRDAEALARALESAPGGGAAPDDALGAAALLRYARDGGALHSERAERILAAALPKKRRAPALGRRWRWFGALGLGFAAAATALLVLSPRRSEGLPTPPRALLEVEASAAAQSADLDALNREMKSYRGAVYASLEERYRR
jgi:hypothetical protein